MVATDAQADLIARHLAMPCVNGLDVFRTPLSEKTLALVREKSKARAEAFRERLQREYRARAAERDAKAGQLHAGKGDGMPVGAFRNEETERYYRLRDAGVR
ncbi:MAG: hypothetical protein AAB601_03215 [Patescibacteria group bacterium]